MGARALLGGLAAGVVAAGSLLWSAVDGSREREAEARPPTPCLFAFVSRVEGDRHLERLRAAGRRVSVAAPNWYLLDLPGGRVSGAVDGRVRRLARRERIAVWPVVNARLGFGPALERGAARTRAAVAIARLARREGFSGITLDMEEIDPAQRAEFSAFVRDVARRLHRAGRWLAVYAPRRTAARVTRSAAAYDWTALARAADLVLASGYNEHAAFTRPGPVTTTRGFRDVLRYAARVSRRRVAPTAGAFGYSWPLGGGPGRLVASHEAERLRVGAPQGSRRVGGARTYVSGGRRVWYETAAGLAERSRAARRAGFRWLGLFSLGREPAGSLRRMAVSGRCGPAAGARRRSSR
jgi:spore germination protein YaaH